MTGNYAERGKCSSREGGKNMELKDYAFSGKEDHIQRGLKSAESHWHYLFTCYSGWRNEEWRWHGEKA